MADENNSDITGDGNNQGETGSSSGENQAGKKFSQAELNAKIGEIKSRLERKFKTDMESSIQDAISSFREEHGLDDAKLENLSKRDQSLSELNKLKKDFSKIGEKASILEKENSILKNRLRDTITRSAVVQAASGKAIDPQDFWHLVKEQISIDDNYKPVVIDDAGEATDLTIDNLVSKILNEKKYLALPTGVQVQGAGSRPSSGRSSNNSGGGLDPLKKEDRLKMLEMALGK